MALVEGMAQGGHSLSLVGALGTLAAETASFVFVNSSTWYYVSHNMSYSADSCKGFWRVSLP